MARVKQSVMERNAFALLTYLKSEATGSPPVAIVSLRMIADRFGISQTRVRRLIRILVERNCIRIWHRFAEDGGELSNAHCITPAGLEALKDGFDQWQSIYGCTGKPATARVPVRPFEQGPRIQQESNLIET